MILAFHGAAGGWDEAAIAVVAFGVLWIAVKLAGRRPAADDDEGDQDDPAGADKLEEPVHPPATPLV